MTGPQRFDDIVAGATDVIRNVADIVDVLKRFGIVGVASSLKCEEVQPEDCLRRTDMHLDLFAYHGEKWLNEAWFTSGLERLQRRGGKVRFLLHDSTGETERTSAAEIKRAFPHTFDLRFFSAQSLFRIVDLDHSTMVITHYGHEVIDEGGHNAKGWQSPQLIVDSHTEWSLCIPFRKLIENVWESASEPRWPDADAEAPQVHQRKLRPVDE